MYARFLLKVEVGGGLGWGSGSANARPKAAAASAAPDPTRLGTVCIFAERNDSGNGASGRKHADEACVFVVERRTKHDQGMRLLERKSRKRIPCRSSSCSVVPGMRETGWLVSMVSSCKKRQSPLSFGWFRRGGIGGVERNRYCKENKTTLQ